MGDPEKFGPSSDSDGAFAITFAKAIAQPNTPLATQILSLKLLRRPAIAPPSPGTAVGDGAVADLTRCNNNAAFLTTGRHLAASLPGLAAAVAGLPVAWWPVAYLL